VVEDNDDQREMPEGRYVRLAIKCIWRRWAARVRRQWGGAPNPRDVAQAVNTDHRYHRLRTGWRRRAPWRPASMLIWPSP